jgi:hypothetical protein
MTDTWVLRATGYEPGVSHSTAFLKRSINTTSQESFLKKNTPSKIYSSWRKSRPEHSS